MNKKGITAEFINVSNPQELEEFYTKIEALIKHHANAQKEHAKNKPKTALDFF